MSKLECISGFGGGGPGGLLVVQTGIMELTVDTTGMCNEAV